MRYLIVAEAYRDLEQVSSRLALTERLAALLAQTPAELLPTVCYLCQGLIAPEFAGVDLGLAEKLAIRVVAAVAGRDAAHVATAVREAGDLGQAAEQLLAAAGAVPGAGAAPVAGAGSQAPGLEVADVVRTLREIAVAEGTGSQGRKLELLAGLLARATPLEARYLLRLVTRNLRLGIGTPTVLDALAQVHAGGKAARPVLERGYNICCDLGQVAATLVAGGLAAVEQLRVQPGNPVRVMLAQRLSDAGEILARLGGSCAAEYKYDGIRVQAHRTADGTIELFTRRLEEISDQFPDIVDLLAAGLGPAEAIIEGEVVAYDAAAGELRPFGEVMLRRRKHGIDQAVLDVPVGLFCFELLYADGQDLTMRPYRQRRAALEAALTLSPRLRLTTAAEVADPVALDALFAQAVTDGCEGLVCKSTGPDSAYQAGARGWQWIKLKRDYRTELSDTADLVVIGAFAGRGRRVGGYGAVLLAAYDADADMFRAVTKCGAGFSDADLAALPARLTPLQSPHRPARVDARQEPDVWFEPGLVLEILSAELTVSPNYTAAWGQIRDDGGLAMRFPRFTGRWRDDKAAEDATTTRELAELFLTARRTPASGKSATLSENGSILIHRRKDAPVPHPPVPRGPHPRDLALAEARALVRRAVDKAEQLGLRGAIAVVGATGTLVTASRMDAGGPGGMARARSKAWISATQQIPSAEHLHRMTVIAGPVAAGFAAASPEALFPGAGGLPVVQDGVVVAGISASGATVSPFFPAGADPRLVSADGKPANPEDLLIAYALEIPYAGQHGDDGKRWAERFGGLTVDPADSLGMAPAPPASRQAQLDWARSLCDAALEAAAGRGARVAVAVVDRGGDPVQQDLMDGAPAGGVAIAQAVAGAAALFDCASGDLAARFGPAGALAGLSALVVPPVLAIPGGLPVRDAGDVVAGLGVGGGDPAVCADIARTALAALAAS